MDTEQSITPNSKHWFTASFLQPLPCLVRQGMSFIAANKVHTSTNKTAIICIETELFFFTQGGCVSCLHVCLGPRLLLQSYQYPNLSEGADRVGGQLRGDKECPFSGVINSGRVWRKVPESDAQSVGSGCPRGIKNKSHAHSNLHFHQTSCAFFLSSSHKL